MALSRRRKFLLIAAFVILGVLLVAAALPLWFPWALRPAAKRFGATYSQYQREGYQRFHLTSFAYTNQSGRFRAKQVEAFVPTVWLWRCFAGPKSAAFLRADSWNWIADAPAGTNQTGSAYRDFSKAVGESRALRKWLPKAELTGGALHLSGQTLQIQQAVWADGKLSAKFAVPRLGNKAFHLLAATQPLAPPGLMLDLDSDDLQFHSRFSAIATNRQLTVQGTAFWVSNRIELNALLPEKGFVPVTASTRADSFDIPASEFQLQNYRSLTGSLDANWQSNRFKLNFAANAVPDSPDWPPIRVEAGASGDTRSAQIDLANISTPWLDARLSRPATILFTPPYLGQTATLEVAGDLAKQHWFAARGKLSGDVILQPGAGRFPTASFTFAGTGLSISNVTAKTFSLKGDFHWPQLELAQAETELTDGSTLTLSGAFDIQARAVQNGQLHFSGGFGQHYLPSILSYKSASVDATLAGPVTALTNSATLHVDDLQIPRARPLRLDANWRGIGMDLGQIQLALSAGNSSLQMRGAAQLSGSEKQLDVAALELSRINRTELGLEKPFTATFQRSPASSNSWTLAIQPVIWSGTGSGLQLSASAAWPQTGTFQISAHDLDSSLIQDFLQASNSEAEVKQLTFAGGWTNGPIGFAFDSTANWKDKLAFNVNATITGGAGGVSIQRLSISSRTQTVCQVAGLLPMTLHPDSTNGFVRVDENGALRLQAVTQTNSILWTDIARISGVMLSEPRLQANLDGTWDAPEGQIALRAQRIQFSNIRHPLPAVEKIDFLAAVNRGELRIPHFNFLLQGQPVGFTAQVPLETHFWSTLVSQRTLPNWRKASAHLRIENAQLAPFANLTAGILSRQGTLRADVALQPGGVLTGGLTITNAATQPLAGVGIIRDIRAAVAFNGQTAELAGFSASVGGETLAADGQMPLNIQSWSRNGLPPFTVHLRGTNVPLVRKPSLLLRADLDLALTNSESGAGTVSGNVALRDSLFLASLQSLIPENTSSPQQHPPYFSVSAPPWAGWHLGIHVRGDQFMRVETPVFGGKVSADLRLVNTLNDPLAIGQIRIAFGAVTLPFGSLNVDQGFVTLTSGDPFHPRLFITAATEQFGYNIKLEVTGAADRPVVQFSSTPALSSQQIVMMLTTGQLPAGIGATTSNLRRAEGLGLFFGRNLLSEFGFGSGMENRLSFHSGQEISESGRPTYEVNYKISKRWSVVGEYDRFDQYDLNLKWNIYTK